MFSKRYGYELVFSKPYVYTPEERKQIAAIYKFRKAGAQIWKFDPHVGQKIRNLRYALFHSGKSENEISTMLINRKYGVNIYKEKSYYFLWRDYRIAIKSERANIKRIRTEYSPSGFCRRQKIHNSPNEIIKFVCKIKLEHPKYPQNREIRHIGLELEIGIPKEETFAALLPYASQICLANDASISMLPPGYVSKEIRLLTTEKYYENDVKILCSLLADMKAVVNETCGLHVHLDMRQVSKEVIQQRFENLVRSQKYLQGLVDAKRRNNRYCKPTRSANAFTQRDRYHAINGRALSKFNTIEIRLHHGTIDALEISNWIAILLGIIQAPLMQRVSRTADSFLKKIPLAEAIKEYAKKKIEANSVVPLADIELCEEEHYDEICHRCNETWGRHRGHNCRTQNFTIRGIWSCSSIQTQTEREATINV